MISWIATASNSSALAGDSGGGVASVGSADCRPPALEASGDDDGLRARGGLSAGRHGRVHALDNTGAVAGAGGCRLGDRAGERSARDRNGFFPDEFNDFQLSSNATVTRARVDQMKAQAAAVDAAANSFSWKQLGPYNIGGPARPLSLHRRGQDVELVLAPPNSTTGAIDVAIHPKTRRSSTACSGITSAPTAPAPTAASARACSAPMTAARPGSAWIRWAPARRCRATTRPARASSGTRRSGASASPSPRAIPTACTSSSGRRTGPTRASTTQTTVATRGARPVARPRARSPAGRAYAANGYQWWFGRVWVVAFRVLAAQQRPDHATVARFVERHQEAIAGLFGEVLSLCAKQGLASVGVIAVDGTKLPARAVRWSGRSGWSTSCRSG